MKIVIPGGGGQVGTVLSRAFAADGHEVVVFSRHPTPSPWRTVQWDGRTIGNWVKEIEGADVVINLAGGSVGIIGGNEPHTPDTWGFSIEVATTGTGEPLIDLSAIPPALNAVAADADLVILEGMGRGVESNLDASFTCDAVNLAMLKDIAVAKRHGGEVYDVVCRFRRAPDDKTADERR